MCQRPAECIYPRACAGLDLQRCHTVRGVYGTASLHCAAASACAGAVIPLGECPPTAPCRLICEAQRACEDTRVTTYGVCIRPAKCAHDRACARLDLRRCGTVRAPHSSPNLFCTGASACSGSRMPLGSCLSPAPCALICSSAGACSRLRVSSEGTCVRPAACVGDSACSNLRLRCDEVRHPDGAPGLNCSGSRACAGAAIPLGECARPAPCPLACAVGRAAACSALTVSTTGVCVRPAACVGDRACANATLRCGEVQAPAASPELKCTGEHACHGASIPLGACPPSLLCRVACSGDYACRALRAATRGTCIRPADCVGVGVCAGFQLQCEHVRVTDTPLRCNGSEACYRASIPLGACPRSSVACPLLCSGARACDGFTAFDATCARADGCGGDDVCASAELQPCLAACYLRCRKGQASAAPPAPRCGGAACGNASGAPAGCGPSSAGGCPETCGGWRACAASRRLRPSGACPSPPGCAEDCGAFVRCDVVDPGHGCASAAKRGRGPSASTSASADSAARSASALCLTQAQSQSQAQPKHRIRKRKRSVFEPSAS
eukprot:gene19574-biopygen16297